jgi:hypothetical protein
MEEDLPQDIEDWELTEGELPAGSTLLGSKSIQEKKPRG